MCTCEPSVSSENELRSGGAGFRLTVSGSEAVLSLAAARLWNLDLDRPGGWPRSVDLTYRPGESLSRDCRRCGKGC